MNQDNDKPTPISSIIKPKLGIDLGTGYGVQALDKLSDDAIKKLLGLIEAGHAELCARDNLPLPNILEMDYLSESLAKDIKDYRLILMLLLMYMTQRNIKLQQNPPSPPKELAKFQKNKRKNQK